MAVGVYLEFKDKKRYKLKFTHKELRQLSEQVKVAYGNSKATLDELLSDPFGGWPYLLQSALKGQQPDLTVDETSDLIDRWVSEGNEFVGIRQKLQAALIAAGYLKGPTKDKDVDPDPNEPSPETS